jgi:hypothetical protein
MGTRVRRVSDAENAQVVHTPVHTSVCVSTIHMHRAHSSSRLPMSPVKEDRAASVMSDELAEDLVHNGVDGSRQGPVHVCDAAQ